MTIGQKKSTFVITETVAKKFTTNTFDNGLEKLISCDTKSTDGDWNRWATTLGAMSATVVARSVTVSGNSIKQLLRYLREVQSTADVCFIECTFTSGAVDELTAFLRQNNPGDIPWQLRLVRVRIEGPNYRSLEEAAKRGCVCRIESCT
eukprot:TRINITY_DN9811_c0_g1_i1.p2 TRINITY_DN9811_c0_g1~~TRINITY_DN9811_c0_g1_i1.p2  ORF type:complete len:149 (-),score=7.70 TRINITY_DN9811_c0_g1_i1:31-477(-)